MVLVLVVGDVHVPQRAGSIPGVFRDLFAAGQLSHVMVTGNVGSKGVYDYLCTLAPHVHCTRGQYDADVAAAAWPPPQQQHDDKRDESLSSSSSLPPRVARVRVDDVVLGMVHDSAVVPRGHIAALAAQRRELDVDVLLTSYIDTTTTTGSCTSSDAAAQTSAVVNDDDGDSAGGGGLLVASGSLTGACTATSCTMLPSFALLDVRGSDVSVYLYAYNAADATTATTAAAGKHTPSADGAASSDGDDMRQSTLRGLRVRKHEWAKRAH